MFKPAPTLHTNWIRIRHLKKTPRKRVHSEIMVFWINTPFFYISTFFTLQSFLSVHIRVKLHWQYNINMCVTPANCFKTACFIFSWPDHSAVILIIHISLYIVILELDYNDYNYIHYKKLLVRISCKWWFMIYCMLTWKKTINSIKVYRRSIH